MRRAAVTAIVGGHRALFAFATALLGVGGSLVATDARSVANWCLFIGAAFLMYVGDRLSELEREALVLAKGSPSRPLPEIRLDVFLERRPELQLIVTGLGTSLVVAWAVLTLV